MAEVAAGTDVPVVDTVGEEAGGAVPDVDKAVAVAREVFVVHKKGVPAPARARNQKASLKRTWLVYVPLTLRVAESLHPFYWRASQITTQPLARAR